ncbi:hypothetical protein Kirov_243 [Bacillus phage Kirov]|uniref:Uncharacterized protein n=1 Tax=Bacillus phage Kirov TaxID=2783539 RepID=A0A7U3NKM9_9CAUD|nr:hypothetical protein PQE67_gp061 [Bacillus phage Kirov]QOV08442.1 hypothetical protein Kirov_243 [Bacillus phage Kirov]
MTNTFEEAVEMLEDGMEVTLEINGYSYDIAPADSFIGGDGMDGYISEVLGNRTYDSAEHVLRESIKFLEENGGKVEITF